MVTAPKAPAPAMIMDSSVCLRAFNTWCGTPACSTVFSRGLVRLIQLQDIQQAGQVGRVFRVEREAKVLGHRAQVFGAQLLDRFIKRLEFRDDPPIFKAVVLFQPGRAEKQDLQQAADGFGAQAV